MSHLGDPRTTCEDCGEELWGPDEARGRCLSCQREGEGSENDDFDSIYEDE